MVLCYSVFCFPSLQFRAYSSLPAALPSTEHTQGADTFQNYLLPSVHSWMSVLRISSLICSSPATTFTLISRSGTNTVSSRDPSLAPAGLPSSIKSHHLLLTFTDNLLIIYSFMMDFSLTPCAEMFRWGPLDHPTWSPLSMYLETPSKYQWSHIAQFWFTKGILAPPQHVTPIYVPA